MWSDLAGKMIIPNHDGYCDVKSWTILEKNLFCKAVNLLCCWKCDFFPNIFLVFGCFLARIRCLISFLLGHTLAKRRRVVNSEQISGRAAAQQISSQEANFGKQAELMRTLNTHTHTGRHPRPHTHTIQSLSIWRPRGPGARAAQIPDGSRDIKAAGLERGERRERRREEMLTYYPLPS